MKKGLLLMTALLFISGALMAQKVVTNADNRAFIDCRAMLVGAITENKKARTIPTGDPDDVTNICSTENNKTVSHYFEVAKEDHTAIAMVWEDGINGCAGIADDGKGLWRLPTQRELQLVWILHQSLTKVAGFTAFSTNSYWSATQYILFKGSGWRVSFAFDSVLTNREYKTNTYRVRCIRDVTP